MQKLEITKMSGQGLSEIREDPQSQALWKANKKEQNRPKRRRWIEV